MDFSSIKAIIKCIKSAKIDVALFDTKSGDVFIVSKDGKDIVVTNDCDEVVFVSKKCAVVSAYLYGAKVCSMIA